MPSVKKTFMITNTVYTNFCQWVISIMQYICHILYEHWTPKGRNELEQWRPMISDEVVNDQWSLVRSYLFTKSLERLHVRHSNSHQYSSNTTVSKMTVPARAFLLLQFFSGLLAYCFNILAVEVIKGHSRSFAVTLFNRSYIM